MQLETGELKEEPQVREKMAVCKLHLDRLIDLKGENVAVREMRKHAAWAVKMQFAYGHFFAYLRLFF